eukprot:g21631.t1
MSSVRSNYAIRVHLIEARGLSAMENKSRGAPDVLCRIRIGPQAGIERWTERKLDALNTVWDAQWFFPRVSFTDSELEREKLFIHVINRKIWTPNETIGAYEFSLSNIHRQDGHQYYRHWVTVAVPGHPLNAKGQLLVSVFVIKAGEDTPGNVQELSQLNPEDSEDKNAKTLEPPHVARHPYVLNVSIYRGEQILASQKTTASPFVAVRFNQNVIQTEHKNQAVAGIWNRRFELPFHEPLSSDPIEIQLWDHCTALPDQLIAQRTFNYYEHELSHSVWGPAWVHFYSGKYNSPSGTLLGGLQNAMMPIKEEPPETEYVGRVLVRMSVRRCDDSSPPRLLPFPAVPTPDPEGDDYALYILLYSAHEIPVTGGQCMVEVTFGERRLRSRLSFLQGGKPGVFKWDQVLEEPTDRREKAKAAKGEAAAPKAVIAFHPKDVYQLPDLIINLYHRVGRATRKMAFQRISAQQLLPSLSEYHVNGHRLHRNQKARWPVAVHSLRPLLAPVGQGSGTAAGKGKEEAYSGFVLASIGFGLHRKLSYPLPLPSQSARCKWTLRCYLFHAAHLTPATQAGRTDPLLVLRFAGKQVKFQQKVNTDHPYYFQVTELKFSEDQDPTYMPTLQLLAYHVDQGVLGRVSLLGRAEISPAFLFTQQRVRFRFALHAGSTACAAKSRCQAAMMGEEQVMQGGPDGPASPGPDGPEGPVDASGPAGQEEVAKVDSAEEARIKRKQDLSARKQAYVVAAFELFRSRDAKRHPPAAFHGQRVTARRFALKTECLGLRRLDLTGAAFSEDSAPAILLQLPTVPTSWTDPSPPPKQKTQPERRQPVAYTLGGADEENDSQPGLAGEDGSTGHEHNHNHAHLMAGPDDGPTELKRFCHRGKPVKNDTSEMNASAFWPEVLIPVGEEWAFPLKIVANQYSVEEDEEPSAILGTACVSVAQAALCGRGWKGVICPTKATAGAERALRRQLRVKPAWYRPDQAKQQVAALCSASKFPEQPPPAAPLLPEWFSSKQHDAQDVTELTAAELLASGQFDAHKNSTVFHVAHKLPAPLPNALGMLQQPAAPREEVHELALAVDGDVAEERDLLNVRDVTQQALWEDAASSGADGLWGVTSALSAFDYAIGMPNGPAGGGPPSATSPEPTRPRGPPIPLILWLHRPAPAPSEPASRLLSSLLDLSLLEAGDNAVRDPADMSTHSCRASLYIRLKQLQDEQHPDLDQKTLHAELGALEEDSLLDKVERLYQQLWHARVYVYKGQNLDSRDRFSERYAICNPYLLVSNGTDMRNVVDMRHDGGKHNTVNPEFMFYYDMQTRLPENGLIKIEVWDRNDLGGDSRIGEVLLDVEERVLHRRFLGKRLQHQLYGPEHTSHGYLTVRLDVLTEDEARTRPPEPMNATETEEFELRMVISKSQRVRNPMADADEEQVDQQVVVTSNFNGEEVVKTTDVAWYSAKGDADWNHRMKWRVKLPAAEEHARLNIAIWDANVLTNNTKMGEVVYNLQPFFQECLRDLRARENAEGEWLKFTHPDYDGDCGQVHVQFNLKTAADADAVPVGEAQNEPNRDPFLPPPFRNAPPWAFGTRGLQLFERRKRRQGALATGRCAALLGHMPTVVSELPNRVTCQALSVRCPIGTC